MTDPIEQLNKVLKGCKIAATCIHVFKHRHFAFYDLILDPGCRINKIRQFLGEIALAMRCTSTPIIKTIPSKGIVRLQLTHSSPEVIQLAELYATSPKGEGFLPFLLGETDEGKPLWVDMSKNPHLLVAGSTGSGKSIFLHNIIFNAFQTRDLDLYLVDTKLVEFSPYMNHPKVINVAQSYTDAIAVLENLCQIMETRYAYLKKFGLSSIENNPRLFKKILFVVDEAADLMLADKSRMFERLLIKLAAKSRAAGIYIVLATQRPSVDVVTGLIKANFPARLACKVTSRADSQIIMDIPGAENLCGRGDALFKNPNMDIARLQIAFTSSALNCRV